MRLGRHGRMNDGAWATTTTRSDRSGRRGARGRALRVSASIRPAPCAARVGSARPRSAVAAEMLVARDPVERADGGAERQLAGEHDRCDDLRELVDLARAVAAEN